MVGDGLAGCDAETAPAFALRGFEALEEVEEGEGRGGLGGRLWVGEFGEGCGLSVSGWLYVEVRSRGKAEVEEQSLPDWTDHGSSRAAAGGGPLETASRISLGSERTFEVALSGGESGADMVVLLASCPNWITL